MDRSRSSKRQYFINQNYDSDIIPRTKPRYTSDPAYQNNNRPPPRSIAGNVGIGRKLLIDPSLSVTTSYRILCHDSKAGGVIGKSGSIIKAIRQHTGAWINVHELLPGDEERVIEISDTRRRDPDERMPEFSPAQEALFLIHERILQSDVGPGGGGGGVGEDGYGYGNGRGGGEKQIITRLAVSRLHIGSLMGRGGKIIEQMRVDTKTQIRILPRDPNIPRCVAMSEEIVQILGCTDAVKNAVSVISSRLRECQHRDRIPFNGHMPSHPDGGSNFGSNFPSSGRINNNYSSGDYEYALDSSNADNDPKFFNEDIVFRILCPIEKVDYVVGVPNGIINMLHNVVGVDIWVNDPVSGSKEQIIVVTSDEGPNDELFPAQEALLHIQTRIVDLEPEKENIIITRLLLHSDEIRCFDEKNGSSLSLIIKDIADVKVGILPREELPVYVSDTDEIVQIVGEIKAARKALIELTSKLRDFICKGSFSQKDNNTSVSVSVSSSPIKNNPPELAYDNIKLTLEDDLVSESSTSTLQNATDIATTKSVQESITSASASASASASGAVEQNDRKQHQEAPIVLNRISMALVTRSTLEIVIPLQVASKLVTKSRNKLLQISELSGANVQLIEDKGDVNEKVIRISGIPERAERAQSLLQGFILSMEEDEP